MKTYKTAHSFITVTRFCYIMLENEEKKNVKQCEINVKSRKANARKHRWIIKKNYRGFEFINVQLKSDNTLHYSDTVLKNHFLKYMNCTLELHSFLWWIDRYLIIHSKKMKYRGGDSFGSFAEDCYNDIFDRCHFWKCNLTIQ